MGDGFFVDTGAMRAHADHVDALSASAGRAVSAAEQVDFSAQMFGSLGAALVWHLMAPLQGAGVVATRAIEGSLGDTAEAVRMTARTFDFVDDEVHQLMTKLKG